MVIVSHTLPDFFGIGENRSQRCQQDNSTIKIKDKQIKPVNTNRFVGFELDSKLNWKSHITSKCQLPGNSKTDPCTWKMFATYLGHRHSQTSYPIKSYNYPKNTLWRFRLVPIYSEKICHKKSHGSTKNNAKTHNTFLQIGPNFLYVNISKSFTYQPHSLGTFVHKKTIFYKSRFYSVFS